jgi:hypothetical protein
MPQMETVRFTFAHLTPAREASLRVVTPAFPSCLGPS